MFIPSWWILVGVFVIIAIWAAATMAGSLESMAHVSTAPTLEAAAGRAAIRGTIFILGVVLVAIAILAAFYSYYRKPAVPLLQDTTLILTTPVPIPCGGTEATPSPSCKVTPSPTSSLPTATPPATPATPTPASRYALVAGQDVIVSVAALTVIGSGDTCPDKASQPIVIARETPLTLAQGPSQVGNELYWRYNAGECQDGWGPETVDGRPAVATLTPTPSAATPWPIARQAPAR